MQTIGFIGFLNEQDDCIGTRGFCCETESSIEVRVVALY